MDFPFSLIQSLRAAQRIVALTGAGISAESGLATFRDAQTGLWSKFKPEELATPDAFRRNPKLVSDWYAWRRGESLKAEPNAGHCALVEMEKRAPKSLLVTQNVDGLWPRICLRSCGKVRRLLFDWDLQRRLSRGRFVASGERGRRDCY